MNRRLDGELLTVDDFIDIAITNGLATVEAINKKRGEIHNEPLFATEMRTLTAGTRLTMFNRGELGFSTRPE